MKLSRVAARKAYSEMKNEKLVIVDNLLRNSSLRGFLKSNVQPITEMLM